MADRLLEISRAKTSCANSGNYHESDWLLVFLRFGPIRKIHVKAPPCLIHSAYYIKSSIAGKTCAIQRASDPARGFTALASASPPPPRKINAPTLPPPISVPSSTGFK